MSKKEAPARCFLELERAEDIDADDCPAGLLPMLVNAPHDLWSGYCTCGEWWMPGPAFAPSDVANAWGDHLTPDDDEPRILFARMTK